MSRKFSDNINRAHEMKTSSNIISYTKKKDKYVFNKDGVYFSLTQDQAIQMLELLKEIQHNLTLEILGISKGGPDDPGY